MAKKVSIWGFQPGGKSQLFELEEGEGLPSGWQDKVPAGEHPHEIELAQAKAAYEAAHEAHGMAVQEPVERSEASYPQSEDSEPEHHDDEKHAHKQQHGRRR